jgi:hypothetical protein
LFEQGQVHQAIMLLICCDQVEEAVSYYIKAEMFLDALILLKIRMNLAQEETKDLLTKLYKSWGLSSLSKSNYMLALKCFDACGCIQECFELLLKLHSTQALDSIVNYCKTNSKPSSLYKNIEILQTVSFIYRALNEENMSRIEERILSNDLELAYLYIAYCLSHKGSGPYDISTFTQHHLEKLGFCYTDSLNEDRLNTISESVSLLFEPTDNQYHALKTDIQVARILFLLSYNPSEAVESLLSVFLYLFSESLIVHLFNLLKSCKTNYLCSRNSLIRLFLLVADLSHPSSLSYEYLSSVCDFLQHEDVPESFLPVLNRCYQLLYMSCSSHPDIICKIETRIVQLFGEESTQLFLLRERSMLEKVLYPFKH